MAEKGVVVASLPERLRSLPPEAEADELGLTMAMVYAEPD